MSETDRTARFVYEGARTKEISFPLGGIGTGSIGLAGNGGLIDWEIANAPNKRSTNGFSFFAIKAETADGRLLDARVLQGDVQPPYMGQPMRGGPLHSGYGFGPDITTLAGMPHFESVSFDGRFPVAGLTFADRHFPGKIAMTAFNPFIPTNEDDSSVPGAMFEIEAFNPTEEEIVYTVCLSVSGRVLGGPTVPGEFADGAVRGVRLVRTDAAADEPAYGELALTTDSPEGSAQQHWYRGGWSDPLEMFWRDFARSGALKPRRYDRPREPGQSGGFDTSSLAAGLRVAAGASAGARFAITWSVPNRYNFWNPVRGERAGQAEGAERTEWRNYYASLFAGSPDSAVYLFRQWDRLRRETLTFRDALFGSTLPPVAIEAVAANLAVLKSPTCLRLADGTFYGFEGCIEDVGSCEGSCTHVWNYAYALPFLFPRLERSMRELDFRVNQRANGMMQFRLPLPLDRADLDDFRACADGQLGGVIKAYRDWKICGDDEWLRRNWPAIKRSIEYAWHPDNPDRWDPEREGVLRGRQHHTLDMELFGPSSWLNGFYLAALKAGAAMADRLGETDTAETYRELFAKGSRWTEDNLFNGEYYAQRIDLTDRALLEAYGGSADLFGDDAIPAYWNEETGEIKYQIGEGCMIDQVLAGWHARLCGLGEIFAGERVRSALAAVYKYNFKPDMREEANTWRVFSLNGEGGLIICSWPPHVARPAVPLTYATETMTGFEYQAAVHMIMEGLVDEGLRVIEAIRERFDGAKRNPWNEFECGSNYARSLASYSLLPAFGGFEYDLPAGWIGFDPIRRDGEGRFRSFWSLDAGWGTFEAAAEEAAIELLYGELTLSAVKLPFLKQASALRFELGALRGEAQQAEEGLFRFAEPVRVPKGGRLVLRPAAES